VNSWPAWLLLVSLVPHRVLAAGGSPIRDGNPARPGCRDFDVRSPLLTCAECYRAAPTTRGRSIELGSGHHASPVRRLSDATEPFWGAADFAGGQGPGTPQVGLHGSPKGRL